jgi:hypothetical protein
MEGEIYEGAERDVTSSPPRRRGGGGVVSSPLAVAGAPLSSVCV